MACVDSRLLWVRGVRGCSRRYCGCTLVRRSHSTRHLKQHVCVRYKLICCWPTHFSTGVIPFVPTEKSCNGGRTCIHEICSSRTLCRCRNAGGVLLPSAQLVSLAARGPCCSARLTATQRGSIHDPFDGRSLSFFCYGSAVCAKDAVLSITCHPCQHRRWR